MRIHIVSLPHTETTQSFEWCAYTAKVRKFSSMMYDLGHEVYLYAGEENEARCTEHISLVSRAEQQAWWPGWDAEKTYWPDGWDASKPWWGTMNTRAIEAIRSRLSPHDILGIIGGNCQKPISDALPELFAVEWGIGYEGVYTNFRCFESYAWMHHVYGLLGEKTGKFFDCVIPNFFEPSQFAFSEKKDDYLLYIGRMIPDKGLAVVEEIAKRHKVITAGQGDLRINGAEHLGVVRGKEKADLFAKARAVLVPTFYVEPFGGVAVEAMMSGTPVITTDWGAFSETVQHGVTGFRCRMLGEFLDAADRVDDLDPYRIELYAQRYSTINVGPKFERYLTQVKTLEGPGWPVLPFDLLDSRYQ